jgi:hypothetical protein
LSAAEVLPPTSERFATANATEVPDFQRHVVPLLGRLGCNGRACHGSFQGQGGMRLSLFGYDFQMDYTALTGQATAAEQSRINPQSPRDSLILRKPTLATDHEGGKRFKTGSWEHRLLLKWIESGARGVAAPRELQALQAEPPEVVFGNGRTSQPLRVIACWKDGSREDVTPLCRFRTNSDAIVTVDRDALLKSIGPGDTHVVAFYDNGVVAVPVMRPVSVLAGARYPVPSAGSRIDQLVQAKLQKLGIVPAPVCSDAEFLRRVSIDLTGTLPTPDEIARFLADPAADKRTRKIDELLERSTYAAWWANKLCDFTGCNPDAQADHVGQEVAVQWYMWIYGRLRENMRYDELVKRIVLALGRREGQSYDDYAAEMSAYYRDDSPADFAQRETMPHFWTRSSLTRPEEKALAFAHSFLGLQLQCAQCHKHPFDSWTQSDFQQLAEFFSGVRYDVPADGAARFGELAKQVGLATSGFYARKIRPEHLKHARAGGTLPWRELYIAERSGPATLSLLRSRVIQLAAAEDPRRPILQWMLEPGNPWFARALVNRVWAAYFHVGIVDPPDDLNPANPPSNPELLEWLAASFVENGYDMKWLHRQIVSSDAYQRSWKPDATNRDDRRNFSRAVPRRLPAEVVYDSLKQVVAASDRLDEVQNDLTRRVIGHSSMRFAGTYAMQVFGKPDRAVNCDCERNNQPSLLQSIFLHNDPLIQQNLDESGWLQEISVAEQAGKPPNRHALVREAWLRTLSRPPQPAEIERAEKHFAQAASLSAGLRDLLWALINTKEFILNH